MHAKVCLWKPFAHQQLTYEACIWLCCMRREGAYSEEEMVRLGREAGEQLKAEAGPEFTKWQH